MVKKNNENIEVENKDLNVNQDNKKKKAKKKKDDVSVGFQVIVNEFKKDKVALVSFFAVATFIVAIFITALFINIEELNQVSIFDQFNPPSFDSFWNCLGRDEGGRSVAGLLVVGTRNSLIVAFCITVITEAVGLFLGLLMGFYGGKIDKYMMRVVDFIGILPILLIIIAFVSSVPKYNVYTFILIMSAFYWTGTARLVRSKALSEGRRDYVSASKTMGTSNLKIMFGGILPNISSILIVDATLALAGNVGIETSLSFLGFGLPASSPSLGTLIAYASKPEIIETKMYVWLPATLVVLFMMLCINYCGQALRRAADAKQRLG